MSTIREAAEAITAALKTVEGVRNYTDPAATVDPPATFCGPPRLQWADYCAGPPTSATFIVFVMVGMRADALERLWDLVPRVATVLDEVPDTSVRDASPGIFNSGGTDLPSYDITVEVTL